MMVTGVVLACSSTVLLNGQDYYFQGDHLWNLFIERINLEFRKRLAREHPESPDFASELSGLLALRVSPLPDTSR
jgi:hypothetical protein